MPPYEPAPQPQPEPRREAPKPRPAPAQGDPEAPKSTPKWPYHE